jgi:glycosyltransferase involved in cell wall biosynthesis
MPEISVIVPVRDGASSLPALLSSLRAQDLDPGRFEVLVVDNGSRDGSGRLAASFGARVECEPMPNRSRARNAGVKAARADLLAFIDADCTASPQWLSKLLACRGRAPLIAGPVEMETQDPPNSIEQFEACWRFDQKGSVSQGWATTANLMVERSAFDAVGGQDPVYDYGEDVDFCIRAQRSGFELAYCESAVVRHGAERKLRPVLRRAFLHGYGAAQLMRRLGVGHVAWRHPRPLVSPRAALAWHSVPPDRISGSVGHRLAAVAYAAYAARIGGSLWALLRRAR